MDTTLLNIKLALISLIPIYFAVISLVRFPGYWGNSKIWALMFHLAFLICIIFNFRAPTETNLVHGLQMLLLSLILTVITYLNIVQMSPKKLQTIWKIPLVGSLIGLYLPFGLAELFISILGLTMFGIVVQSKDRLFLLIKPMMGVVVGLIGYQFSTVIADRPWAALLFGLISYLSAERILNVALIKDWMKSVEQY